MAYKMLKMCGEKLPTDHEVADDYVVESAKLVDKKEVQNKSTILIPRVYIVVVFLAKQLKLLMTRSHRVSGTPKIR